MINEMNRTLPERIFICGFMGAGKTTVGTELSKRLQKPFHDLDVLITEQTGQTISEIFEREGEEEFRQYEKKALLDVIRNRKGVIALGGGTLQNQHLVDHVKVNGLLVFIDTPMNEVITRIMEQEHRPLLLDEEGEMKSESELRVEMQKLYEERFSFYEQAEITVNSGEYQSTEELANELVKKIKYHVALY